MVIFQPEKAAPLLSLWPTPSSPETPCFPLGSADLACGFLRIRSTLPTLLANTPLASGPQPAIPLWEWAGACLAWSSWRPSWKPLSVSSGRAVASGRPGPCSGARTFQSMGPRTSPRPRFQGALPTLVLGWSVMRICDVSLTMLVWEVLF